MSYAKIIAKKIRMCARFAHLPPAAYGRRRMAVHPTLYYCRRCGATVDRATRKVGGATP